MKAFFSHHDWIVNKRPVRSFQQPTVTTAAALVFAVANPTFTWVKSICQAI
jgi:hypothetical protein